MEEVKICVTCGKNLGKQVCMNCGALVCDYCYSRKRGTCVSCIKGRTLKNEKLY